MNPLAADIQYTYQVCPIFLTGGAAANLEGGTLPIISLLNAGAFPNWLSSGTLPGFNLDAAFAQWHPNPGGTTLVSNDVAKYPLANQVSAGNAMITNPLNVALTMIAPFRSGSANVSNRQAVITSLKQTLDQHVLAGGTFIVSTISYTYADALLLNIRDASSSEVTIPQWRWVWEFEIPLISLQAANNVSQRYNSLMNNMASGQVVQPNADGNITWSGPRVSAGSTGSGVAPVVIPAARQSTTLGGAPSSAGLPALY